ncbi:hypothetical protein AB3S75_037253 [Citrus x aurantiifolia]
MGSPQVDARSAQVREARPEGARCQPRSRRRRLHRLIEGPGLDRRRNLHRSVPRADRRTGSRRSASDRGASPVPIRFPPDNFKHSLTLFSKSFSSFPRGTCLLSVSRPYLPPDLGCIPKQPDSQTVPRGVTGSERDGALTLSGAPFQGTWARSAAEDASPDYNSDTGAPDFQAGLFPVRSLLLRESW